METLLLPIAKFAVRAQHNLQMPGQLFFREQLATRATRARSSDETCSSAEFSPAILATVTLRKKRPSWRAK